MNKMSIRGENPYNPASTELAMDCRTKQIKVPNL